MGKFSKVFLAAVLLMLSMALVSAGRAQPVEPVQPTLRVGFLSGNFKIFASYLITNNKSKSNEFTGCHNITVGYPEGWEILGVQSYGRETYCYDVTFKLKDGSCKLCRVDLRKFNDAARSDQVIELHFRDEVGDINFVPSSRAR